MPFVKNRPPTLPAKGKPGDGLTSLIASLGSPDFEIRWNAARTLGGCADAVAALTQALSVEKVARVREAIMTALLRVGDESSVRALLPYLRSQDAVLRGTAIEALQALPEATTPFMAALFAD